MISHVKGDRSSFLVSSRVPSMVTACTTVNKNPLANLTSWPIPSNYLSSPLPLSSQLALGIKCGNVIINMLMAELYILLLLLRALKDNLQHLRVLLPSPIPRPALPSSHTSETSWKLSVNCQGLWSKAEDRLFTPVARRYFTLVMAPCLKTKEV